MDLFKTRPVNPFYDTIDIPDEYFCDRQKETEDLINKIKNGPNVVLVAERRVGKTSLIFHLFKSKEIQGKYNTAYIDVFSTKTPEDFINAFKEGLLQANFTNSEHIQIDQITKEFSGKLGISIPPLTVEAEAKKQRIINIENTLGRLFDFLGKTSKPNLVVFDEFQEIENYQDKITPQLRSYIQRLNNTRFIYSGSSAHQLTAMFTENNRAFYKSSSLYGLDKIQVEPYIQFCQITFAKYGKAVESDAVTLVYNLFKGITLDLQLVMKKIFEQTPKGETANVDSVKKSIDLLLNEQDMGFATRFNAINGQMQRNVLLAVAAEGIAENITSATMISRYHLMSASHIQNALNKLTDKNNLFLIKIAKGAYVMDNKFFELWIARKMKIIDTKYEYAEALYKKEREISERQISFQLLNPNNIPLVLQQPTSKNKKTKPKRAKKEQKELIDAIKSTPKRGNTPKGPR